MSGRLGVWRGAQCVGELWLGADDRSMGFAYAEPQPAMAISNSLPLSGSPFPPEQALENRGQTTIRVRKVEKGAASPLLPALRNWGLSPIVSCVS